MEYIFESDYVVGVTSSGIKFMFDVEDYPMVAPYNWCVSSGYVHRRDKTSDVKLHRVLMNCPDGMVVDHINHNTLDNRKENLRICTLKENARNKSYSSNNTSGKIGVYWKSSRQKWVAQIKIDGKVKHLGIFKNYDDAVKCRLSAEKEYFGEYAYKYN